MPHRCIKWCFQLIVKQSKQRACTATIDDNDVGDGGGGGDGYDKKNYMNNLPEPTLVSRRNEVDNARKRERKRALKQVLSAYVQHILNKSWKVSTWLWCCCFWFCFVLIFFREHSSNNELSMIFVSFIEWRLRSLFSLFYFFFFVACHFLSFSCSHFTAFYAIASSIYWIKMSIKNDDADDAVKEEEGENTTNSNAS